MRRGTTQTHTFTIPFNLSLVSKLRITYKQGDKVVITKTEQDIKKEGANIIVSLTQQETLMFNDSSIVEIQLKVLTNGGDVLATEIYNIHPLPILDEEVL